jgi:hypothetical protein
MTITKQIIAALALAAVTLVGPAAAQSRDYGINVINDTGTTIEYFYFSACRDQNWGRDRLGNQEVIRDRQSRFFDMHDGIQSCCRDMRAKLVNGASRQRMNVDVCAEHQWVVK